MTVPDPIAGGGVGGGDIVDTAFIHVIDDATRDPIAGAHVLVGNYAGTTDANGLVVATGLTAGKQQLTTTAEGYRAEMWLGVNGQNLTVDLHVAAPVDARTARLSGTVEIGTVDPSHTRTATVTCSETTDIGDPANALQQPANGTATANVCTVLGDDVTGPCTFSVVCRQGSIALLARIVDAFDSTPDQSTISYAYLPPIQVTGDQSNLSLAAVRTSTVNVALGTPAGQMSPYGVIGIELDSGDVFQLRDAPIVHDGTAVLPLPADVDASATRLTAIAVSQSGGGGDTLASVTLLRHVIAPMLGPPTYLAPPATLSASPTGAMWSLVPGATVQSVQYSDPTSGAALLSVTSFDGTRSFTLPALPELTMTAPLTVGASALFAQDLDLTSFGLDADGDKVTRLGQHQITAH